MSLVTGTPVGTIATMDAIYTDIAPTVFFQPIDLGGGAVSLLNNPDSDGFYWGLSATSTNKVFELGCYENFQWGGNIEMNNIRCDTQGDTGVVQRLSSLDITFTLKSLFPLSTLRHILRWGTPTVNAGVEKVGIGEINNNLYYYVYFPLVYDTTNGDYVSVTVHKAQFVDSYQISHPYGQQGSVGITLRGFADKTKPSDQQFATVIRADASAL